MGWGKVHENILKLPFCEFKQQIVRMVIRVEYPNCYFEGCCFPCFESEGTIHNPSVTPPKKPKLLIEADPDSKNFLEIYSWNGYNWHDWFLLARSVSEKLQHPPQPSQRRPRALYHEPLFATQVCNIHSQETRPSGSRQSCFHNMQTKPSVSKSQFEAEGFVLFFIISASTLPRMSFSIILTSTSVSPLFDGWRSILART